jgi:hypothetical protein
VLHVPIWLWVFFVLPGNLTYDLYLHGPDRRHAIWIALVLVVLTWRGLKGRLPGVEPKPYITHWGVDQPNLPYRVACYTAAWIALLVPAALNLAGLVIAVLTGRWMLAQLYSWFYYPLALLMVAGTALNLVPRTKRSTQFEGQERGWFYVAIWTVVPLQLASWAAWRLGSRLGMTHHALDSFRLLVFVAVGAGMFLLGYAGLLPRTERYYATAERTMVAQGE